MNANAKLAGKRALVTGAGTPQDIAKLAAFLSSDDAEFTIGQTLVADGGTTSLMSLFPNFREPSDHRFGKGYVPGV